MREFFRELHRQYPLLSWAARYNLVLLAVSAAGLALDSRQVAGINPWIKPIKFETSIIVFLATTGWMLLNLRASARVKRRIAAGVAIAMTVEIAAIVMQAARGVTSHFNNATPFDAGVFALMGIMIVCNTALMLLLLLLYFRSQPELPPAVLWGIRLGLAVFLLASLEGGLLVGNNAHTVGAPDGGEGLFFLNWSTRAGDLRVAHFVGMHGIQLLPLLGWLLSRTDRTRGTGAVAAAFVLLTAVFAWSLREALAGRPLFVIGGR